MVLHISIFSLFEKIGEMWVDDFKAGKYLNLLQCQKTFLKS
jgi:hypothetical protein